jgi:diphthine-ammonia ligase
MQAEAIGLPLLKAETKGIKERELKDLKKAISKAIKEFGIEGIYTGAVKSAYQSKRIGDICKELGISCHNPLWEKDEIGLLKEILENGFEVIISGVFAYPMGKEWLGRRIDEEAIDELTTFRDKYQISPAGEGGEIETTVLDTPFFKKRIEIIGSEKDWNGNSGVFLISKARLVKKQ